MTYYYPFGEAVRPLSQQDRTPKKVFVLGVYASAVHAKWTKDGNVVCQALAVASEPRIFWDGDPDEARAIIGRIRMPAELGELAPAGRQLNGPSAKALDAHILAPLGFTRQDAWLCDCLPETRLNPGQIKVIGEKYNPLIQHYGLNAVTIPKRPAVFCDAARAEAITAELMASEAGLLVLLGDIPIGQYLKRVADVPYSTLREYCALHGYGNRSPVVIQGRRLDVLPLAHPRQIGALGAHNQRWHDAHREWELAVRRTPAEVDRPIAYSIVEGAEAMRLEEIARLLGMTYWANRRSMDQIERSVRHSSCYGVRLEDGGALVGFARVISDYATTYYLCDVIIDPAYRRMGLGTALVSHIESLPEYAGLRGMLITRDAHDLYRKFGYEVLNGRAMVKSLNC